MATGKIKKLVSDKGFGFIAGDGKDLFFHSKEVVGTTFDSLREGQEVEYSVGKSETGPCATSVRLA